MIILLQTCDRFEMTSKVIQSVEENIRGDYEKFYLDDASQDSRIKDMLGEFNWVPLVENNKREGVYKTRQQGIKNLVSVFNTNGYEPVMTLENDTTIVRPISSNFVSKVLEYGAFMRLFGKYCDVAKKDKTSVIPYFRSKKEKNPKTVWTPLIIEGEEMEIGVTHFSHHPVVAPLKFILQMLANSRNIRKNEKDYMSQPIRSACIRPVYNISDHIGYGIHTPNKKV